MTEHGLLNRFCGIDVFVNKHLPEKVPVLQLSNNVDVSDEFRESFDAWLLEMFGSKSVALLMDMAMLGCDRTAIAMPPKHFAMLNIRTNQNDK